MELVVDQIVDELRGKGYLNDDRAVRNAVDYATNERQEGPVKTRDRLLRRGASEEMVEDKLAEIPSERSRDTAIALLEGRTRGWKNPGQAARFLAAKGYDPETIETALAARFEIESEFDEG